MRILVASVLVALLAGCSGGGGDGGGPDEPVAVDWPEPQHEILAGQAIPAGFNVHLIDIAEGHERLAVTLVMVTASPGSLAMNVTAPEGRWDRVSTGPFLYVFPGTRPTVSFLHPETGAWSATVEPVGTSAPKDYEVHFCADSAARPGPQDNLACHRDY